MITFTFKTGLIVMYRHTFLTELFRHYVMIVCMISLKLWTRLIIEATHYISNRHNISYLGKVIFQHG